MTESQKYMDKLFDDFPSDIQKLIMEFIWENGKDIDLNWHYINGFQTAIEKCSTEFWEVDDKKWDYIHIELAIINICKGGTVSMLKQMVDICNIKKM